MNRLLNLGYASIHWTYWMVYGIIGSFASVFLLAKGYSNFELGIIIAAGSVLAVAIQPILADFADRSKKITLMGLGQLMVVVLMLFVFLLMVFKQKSNMLSIVFVSAVAWQTAIQPLFNALSYKLEEAGVFINFGAARSMGSLGYAILCALLGTLVEHYGVDIMPVIAEAILVMLLICVAITKFNYKKAKELQNGKWDGNTKKIQEANKKDDINLIDFVRRNKIFLIVNVGVLGLFFSNSVLNSFMMQIVSNVGGTGEDMGRILSVMAFLEIPTMFCYEWFDRTFGCRKMLKLSALFFTGKIAVCMMAQSVAYIYGAMLLQLFSFGIFMPAMVTYINEIMEEKEAVKGQALFTTMLTVATVISNFAGGYILDKSGAAMLTAVSTAITFAGAVIMLFAVDRVKFVEKNS